MLIVDKVSENQIETYFQEKNSQMVILFFPWNINLSGDENMCGTFPVIKSKGESM